MLPARYSERGRRELFVPGSLDPGVRGLKVFGDHPNVGQDGHEVRVALPARNDVLVHVIDDSGSGAAPEVPADVEPVRLEQGAEHLDGTGAERVDLGRLLRAQLAQAADVANGRDHQVTGRIGEAVE